MNDPLWYVLLLGNFSLRGCYDSTTRPRQTWLSGSTVLSDIEFRKTLLPPNPGIFFRCTALDPTKPGIKGQFLHPSRPHQTYISPILVKRFWNSFSFILDVGLNFLMNGIPEPATADRPICYIWTELQLQSTLLKGAPVALCITFWFFGPKLPTVSASGSVVQGHATRRDAVARGCAAWDQGALHERADLKKVTSN